MSAVASEQAGRRIAELFDAHARMVLGVCRLILRDPGEAEDAAQQTFLSAYRSLLGGTAPREPAPWLAAIARNECRARLRAREHGPVAVDEPTTRDAAEVADERESIGLLTSAIAELPDRQRQALVLRELRGLSYAEVAEVLELPPSAVEALVGRGRRRVRALFRKARPTLVVVPATLRDDLARLIPNFEAATAVGGGAGAVKLAVGITAVAVAVGGSVNVDHAVTPPARHEAATAPAPKIARHRVAAPAASRKPRPVAHMIAARPAPQAQHRSGSNGPGPAERDDEPRSDSSGSSGPGPRSDEQEASSSSGPGSGSDSGSDRESSEHGSSGPGPGSVDELGDTEPVLMESPELDSSGDGDGGSDDGGDSSGSDAGPG